jgi:hypothetical protein
VVLVEAIQALTNHMFTTHYHMVKFTGEEEAFTLETSVFQALYFGHQLERARSRGAEKSRTNCCDHVQ